METQNIYFIITSTNEELESNCNFVTDFLSKIPIQKMKIEPLEDLYIYEILEDKFAISKEDRDIVCQLSKLCNGSPSRLRNTLHPVFTSAVRDGYIRSNPSDGLMADIKKSHTCEKPKRHALTEQQQAKFVEFTAQSYQYKHWLPLFTVLLGTGGRIGEILGLRWEDCDFPNSIININHTLIYRKYTDEASHFAITTPKTKSGVRIIPMLSDVKAALTEEYKEQLESGFNESVVDGYSGFIFKSRDNTVLSPHCVNRAIDRIIKACNAKEEEDAKEERREPELLPHFSCHHLRHTFCTRFCENETNLKIIQEIMGHADITTTMDIYNEATKDKKMESFAGLEGKIKIR